MSSVYQITIKYAFLGLNISGHINTYGIKIQENIGKMYSPLFITFESLDKRFILSNQMQGSGAVS